MSTTTSAADAQARELLRLHRAGDGAASRRLFALLYGELRAIARRLDARAGAPGAVLRQPTALVHDMFLRLDGAELACADRREYLALARRVMLRVLQDRARRERARREPWDTALERHLADGDEHAVRRVLSLEVALERLAQVDPALARVAELRFFRGLDVAAVASALDCSTATVQRDWRTARAFLKREIDQQERDGR